VAHLLIVVYDGLYDTLDRSPVSLMTLIVAHSLSTIIKSQQYIFSTKQEDKRKKKKKGEKRV
jgi:hypothetical protein